MCVEEGADDARAPVARCITQGGHVALVEGVNGGAGRHQLRHRRGVTPDDATNRGVTLFTGAPMSTEARSDTSVCTSALQPLCQKPENLRKNPELQS